MTRHAAGRRWVAAVAALLMLAGCGNALAGSSVAGPAAGGPEARALALARRLVSELRLPAGAAPERLSKLPPGLAAPGAPSHGWARATRIFAVRATPRTVWTALLTHAPFNEAPPASVLPQAVSATTPAPEPGVDATIANVSVAPLSRTTTAVVAYADAAWLPVRSPAEHLDPRDFRAVTASVIRLFPSSRMAARTSTSAQVIAKMTAYLNALQPVPQIVMSGSRVRLHHPLHPQDQPLSHRAGRHRQLPTVIPGHRERAGAAATMGHRRAGDHGPRADRPALAWLNSMPATHRDIRSRVAPVTLREQNRQGHLGSARAEPADHRSPDP